MNSEPTLHDIEDYNGNESKEKRKVVNIVIGSLLFIGLIYASAKYYYDRHTPEAFNPIIYKISN